MLSINSNKTFFLSAYNIPIANQIISILYTNFEITLYYILLHIMTTYYLEHDVVTHHSVAEIARIKSSS